MKKVKSKTKLKAKTFSLAETLQDLFDQIEAAKQELQFEDGEECFYRGERRSDYDLLPSLLRKDFKKVDMETTESNLFYEFSTRAKSLHHLTTDDWDILFYMRHHGTPTRLIDWTETLGVALYFATLPPLDPTSSSALWLMNPYLLNEITWKTRNLIAPRFLLNWDNNDDYEWRYSDFLDDPKSFGIKYPVAIYPPQKSDRMLSQRGWFTFHGTIPEPINKIEKLEECYRKIIISRSLVEPIKTFLEQAGINDFTMFPDLTGLANYLKKKYEF